MVFFLKQTDSPMRIEESKTAGEGDEQTRRKRLSLLSKVKARGRGDRAARKTAGLESAGWLIAQSRVKGGCRDGWGGGR